MVSRCVCICSNQPQTFNLSNVHVSSGSSSPKRESWNEASVVGRKCRVTPIVLFRVPFGQELHGHSQKSLYESRNPCLQYRDGVAATRAALLQLGSPAVPFCFLVYPLVFLLRPGSNKRGYPYWNRFTGPDQALSQCCDEPASCEPTPSFSLSAHARHAFCFCFQLIAKTIICAACHGEAIYMN